jgi:glutamine kinase
MWFTVDDWRRNSQALLAEMNSRFGNRPLAVRSSAVHEDSPEMSWAGHFTSVLSVSGMAALEAAVQQVMDSYGANGSSKDEVLVQPMLTDVRLSGVVFSHDPATGAPYRVVNYAMGTDTTAVTRGAGRPHTFVATQEVQNLPPDMELVLKLVEELLELFSNHPLDIEFAIGGLRNTLNLLQVRPLVLQQSPIEPKQHRALLTRIAGKVLAAQQPHPFLHGRSTVFGVMPDWNPAEIIGIRPRPLALSLYRELVTDAIWAYQRDNYGYRNLRSFPLLVHFGGQPYIDVRLSFNSFIPKDVEGALADRLVDYYIDRLIATPTLHDKVEFEIVFSCYTLDLEDRLKQLGEFGFSESERTQLSESLRLLTNRIVNRENGLWKTDASKLDILEDRRNQILASSMESVSRIYWLLEDCKRYGTLPFAGLARAGFVAVQMLKSLVRVGVLSQGEHDRFLRGLSTIGSKLAHDLRTLDRAEFLSRYGHLRPGTYDILSPRYDETPDAYLGDRGSEHETQGNSLPFALNIAQMRTIAKLLQEHRLSMDVMELFEFLQAGIELREHAKFVFTKNLSDAISLFCEWGGEFGFVPDELAYANIACIRELYAGADDPRTVLAQSIAEGKRRYGETRQLWLPQLITKPDDIWAFHVPECEPNFVTQGNVTGPVVRPDERARLPGGIVFIPSADPGYDWLFTHKIAGLVTAYGGVNSHMAIRANELGLPSVIGAGEALFGQWSKARRLRIDCAERRVEELS